MSKPPQVRKILFKVVDGIVEDLIPEKKGIDLHARRQIQNPPHLLHRQPAFPISLGRAIFQ
jgi:hypothetical protein